MTPDAPRRRPRSKAEAGEQTRASLLEAGAALLRERPVGALFHQVTASEVARRAGRTIGAFYHHWPDQDSFRRDLLAHVLGPEQLPADETVRRVAEQVGDVVEPGEIVRRNARANLVWGVRRPEYVLSVALWAQAGSDPLVRELLLGLYKGATNVYAPMYANLFEVNGWKPRPPFTVESIAVLVTSLLDGLVMRAVVEPEAVPFALPDESGRAVPEDDAAWDLFSAALLALLPTVTMPADAPDDAGPGGTVLDSSADVRDATREIWRHWADLRTAGPSDASSS